MATFHHTTTTQHNLRISLFRQKRINKIIFLKLACILHSLNKADRPTDRGTAMNIDSMHYVFIATVGNERGNMNTLIPEIT